MSTVTTYDPRKWYSVAGQGTIEKCTRVNWPRYQRQMKRLLQSLDLWSIVEGTEEAPGEVPPPTEGATAEQTAARQLLVEKKKTEAKEYRTRQNKATGVIYASCSNEVQRIIEDQETPKDAWDKLKSTLEGEDSHQARRAIQRQFRSCTPKPDQTIDAWLSELQEFRTILDGTDEEITDNDHKRQITDNLPKGYEMEAGFANYDNSALLKIESIIREREATLLSQKAKESGSALLTKRKDSPGQYCELHGSGASHNLSLIHI